MPDLLDIVVLVGIAAFIIAAGMVVYFFRKSRPLEVGDEVPIKYLDSDNRTIVYRRADGQLWQRVGEHLHVRYETVTKNGGVVYSSDAKEFDPNELVEIHLIMNVN